MIDKLKNIFNDYSDRVAYKNDKESITYYELWNKACFYAELLKKQGTDPVILYGDKEVDMVISIIACILSKRAYVPIGDCTPLGRIKKIINITNSSLILSRSKLNAGIECLSLDELEMFDGESIKTTDNDIIYIIFTSGSTGEPKGVPIRENNLLNFINWISGLYPLSTYKNINVLNQASFSFDLSVADLYYSLCNGHTLVAYSNNRCDNSLYNVKFDSNVDYAVMTPTFMKLCLLDEDFNSVNYSNLKCVYFCGETLTVGLVKKIWNRFPEIIIINAYGPTEATSAVSAIVIDKNMLDDNLLPVGDVDNFATEIEIIDDEIVLKGESVFSGYLGDVTGGYYREDNINCYKTGDLGFIRDGRLYCNGRIDSQIKFKGYRIELGEIEHNINLIDGVNDSCVIAKKDENGEVKTIKAFIDGDSSIDSDFIKDKLSEVIPNYMIPRTIVFQKLPVNNNGKIDRKALMDL